MYAVTLPHVPEGIYLRGLFTVVEAPLSGPCCGLVFLDTAFFLSSKIARTLIGRVLVCTEVYGLACSACVSRARRSVY